MKRNRFLLLIILTITVFSVMFCFTACAAKNEESVHTHTYSSQWEYDAMYHWHSDICNHDTISDKGKHSFGNWIVKIPATVSEQGMQTRTCKICGYSEESEIVKVIPETYTITYNLNGGDFLSSVVTSYMYGTGVDRLPTEKDVVREGYVFEGWIDQKNSKITEISSTNEGNVTLFAKWTLIEYTATFKVDGEVVGTAKFTIEDSSISAPAIPEKTGYTSSWENYSIVADDIIINAVYAKINYKIAYLNTKGVVNSNNVSYSIEDETFVLTDLNKAGYVFEGWYDGDEKVASIAKGSYGDRSLTAKWTPIEYTATFKVDGEVVGTAKFTIEDSSISVPAIPEKTGYTSSWENYSIVANDITINAVYILIAYKATFMADGKVIGVSLFNVEDAGIVDEPIIPKKTGYAEKWEEYTLSAKDMTVNAVYTPIKYTIIYTNTKEAVNNNVNEFTVETETFAINVLLNVPGYTFGGWYQGVNHITKIEKGTVGDITLNAEWVLQEFAINYNLNGGTNNEANPMKYTIESEEIVLLAPERSGYMFMGWSDDGKIASSSTGNKEFTADWKIIEYSITYNLNGGTNNEVNPTKYTTESEVVLSDPIKNGYTFLGWIGSNGDIPEKSVNIQIGSTGNREYLANWELTEYTITYVLDGGINAVKNPSTYTITDTINLKDAQKDYYTFEGWYADANFSNEISELYGKYGNLTLYAKFAPYTYTASFDAGNGELVYRVNLFYWENSEVNTFLEFKEGEIFKPYSLKNLYRDNYIFYAWYYDSDFTMPIGETLNVYTDLSLYAKWIYKPNMGGYRKDAVELCSMSVHPYDIGQGQGNVPNCETKYFYVPYSFCGQTTLTYNLYTAHYTTTSGNMIMNHYGSYQVWLKDLTTGVKLFSKSAINKNSSAEGTQKLELVEGHYYQLYACLYGGYWPGDGQAYLSVSVTNGFKNTDIVFVNEANQYYDSATTILTARRKGYDFMGWYDGNDNFITEVWRYTSDKTFYARWELHNYSIDYDLYGGVNDEANPLQYNLESVSIVLKSPTRKGYTFDGWYTDSNFSNQITAIDSSECKDYILFAKWTANTYTVTLDYGGGQNCPMIRFYSKGSLVKEQALYKDSALDYFVPTNSSENLIFGGWYVDEMCTELFAFSGIVTCDLNLYAKWIDISDTNYCDLGSNTSVRIDGNTYQYLAIVLSANQMITISSQSGLDLYGEVFNARWESLAYSDDISDDNLDFSITVTLEAGQIYYVGYRANQASVLGECVISVSGTMHPETFIIGDYTEVIESLDVTYDDSYSLPIPKKDGYVFVGWYDDNGNLLDETIWNNEGDITAFAHWETQGGQCLTLNEY